MKPIGCPYCKSPAPRNPCWWFLDHPDQVPSGGDPPCELYDAEPWGEARSPSRWLWRLGTGVAVLVLLGGAWLLLR